MTEPQDRKMPEEGDGEPGSVGSERSSDDASKNLSHLTQDTKDMTSSSAAAAKVTSPAMPPQTFAWRSDWELGWHAGEGPSAHIRENYSGNDIEDKIWWQIRDYSFDSTDVSPAPEQRWTSWEQEELMARTRSFEENLYRSDDTEWYGQQDWYEMPPGPSGHGSQEDSPFIIPEDDMATLPPDMPMTEPMPRLDVNQFDFEDQASGGVMPRPEVASVDPQAPKESLDSWAPLYRYLGVKTDEEYANAYDYYQPLDPIKESPLEEDNSDDAKEGAVGGAPK